MNPALVGDELDSGEAVLTLSSAFELYRRELRLRNRSSKTINGYSNALNSLHRFYGIEATVDLITFDSIRDYIEWLHRSHVGCGTVRVYLNKTRMVLAYLRLREYNVLDPSNVPLPRSERIVPEVLSPDEVQRLIDAESLPRNKAIISLLYSTGLRMSEMTALNRSQVLEDSFTIRNGKGGYSRIAYIDQRTRKLIDIYLSTRTDNDKCLFYSNAIGGRLGHATVEFMFKNARRKAGFEWPVTAHKLRHSYATNLLKNGADLFSISKLLGHKNINTTAIYLHLVNNELKAIYDKFHTT